MTTTNAKRAKLIQLLEEMFQLGDAAELDFGIYRIMRVRRDEIIHFLNHELDQHVADALKDAGSDAADQVRARLEKRKAQAAQEGDDPDNHPAVLKLKEELAAVDTRHIEDQVYAALLTFFGRYYQDGDFMSLRRIGEDTYAIPYNGEEVKLHWANHDQYYIKSSEALKNYAFILSSRQDAGAPNRVRFELVAASVERDNNKAQAGGERYHMLSDQHPVREENGELVIPFEYRQVSKEELAELGVTGNSKRDELANLAFERVKSDKTVSKEWRDLLQAPRRDRNGVVTETPILLHHLKRYTAKSSFDYFIHKDLGGFLRRELDWYIKHEHLRLDDILADGQTLEALGRQHFAKLRVLRTVAGKLIEFLAQIENFQKKLWLKKKFVLETQYCCTLDMLPKDLWPMAAGNPGQAAEWKQLYGWEKKAGTSPSLMVDTRHFTGEERWRLLEALGTPAEGTAPLDERLGGVLFHGDNFHALTSMQRRYAGQVQCVYIDPPYNTEKDRATGKFIYKDGYSSASWLSMISDRLEAGTAILRDKGALLTSLDDNESASYLSLRKLPNHVGTVVLQTATDNNPRQVYIEHEYIHVHALDDDLPSWSAPSKVAKLIVREYERLKGIHSGQTAEIQSELRAWIRKNKDKLPKVSHYDNVDDRGVYHDGDVANTRAGGYKYDVMHPKTGRPCKVPDNGFRFPEETMRQMLLVGDIVFGADETTLIKPKTRIENAKDVLRSVIYEDGRASTKALDNMFHRNTFDNPKSPTVLARLLRFAECPLVGTSLILDYFAGSGTTAHAVLSLNREDGGSRKYILAEMGEYFDTVLVPRIKKVVFSPDWKDGKPTAPEKGISHAFKYLRLESYEDALDNIELKRSKAQDDLLRELPTKEKEAYRLRYMLGIESQGSPSLLAIEKFARPFEYKLRVTRSDETVEQAVDLVETFNWLLGLKVGGIRRSRLTSGKVPKDKQPWLLEIDGVDPEGNRCLVLWRNTDEIGDEELARWLEQNHYNLMPGAADSEAKLNIQRVYINGDQGIVGRVSDGAVADVRLIEDEFRRLMFEGTE